MAEVAKMISTRPISYSTTFDSKHGNLPSCGKGWYKVPVGLVEPLMYLSGGVEKAMGFIIFFFSSLQHRKTVLSRMPSPFSLALKRDYGTELWVIKYVWQWCPTLPFLASKTFCITTYAFILHQLYLLVTGSKGSDVAELWVTTQKSCLQGTALNLCWGKEKIC